ncbi:DUF2550 domain-containing protein [Actinospica durhamensis]|uniref:DUF2550 domain-containing protein n=1 Tax=Actinospica durhamensis TaxID=1508375 RepID=A0A941ETH2_9ACTN|nr:DUF2550 domain-containing protein [Actinospica durhamensis]MBR7837310.1 DUF2550 domain-containing protein [Actinospica durhamensis]
MLSVVLEFVVSLCLLVLFAIGALFLRRVMIRRRGGTFDCSLRLTPALPGATRAASRLGGPAAAEAEPESGPVRGTGTPLTAAAVRDGRGWSYGIAQYGADRVDWYRIFSYAFRPAAVLTRRDLEVVGRREPEGTEELALFPGWTILDCRFGAGYAELALSEDALTGFLSWLEAAPPGQGVSRVA